MEKKYLLQNGVALYTYENPALHGFYLSLFVKSGSMYEEEGFEGITHLLEHCLIRNVNKLRGGNLYSELDRLGMEFNATTYSELMQFYVTASREKFITGMGVLCELFRPIALSRRELDAERKRVKAEIRESDDKTSLALFSSNIVFGNTPLAHSIVGTAGSVDRVSISRLEAHRQACLTSGNIFFYLTGSFDDEDVVKALAMIDALPISEGEGNSNIAPVPCDFFNRPSEIFIKNSDYTVVRFTFDLDMSRMSVAETDLIYDSLLTGYNSRLFIELSEGRGLVYDVSGTLERYRNVGTLSFSYELSSRHVEEAIRITVDVLNSMKDPASITCVKAGYTDNAYLLYDDIRELNFTFAFDNHIMSEGYSTVQARKERYAAVTDSRLASLAREIFCRKNLTLTMKAPDKKIDKKKIEGILEKLN
jgi:predicted Zn-dependent peptidase